MDCRKRSQGRADTPGRKKGSPVSTLPGDGTAFTNWLCVVVFVRICGEFKSTAIFRPQPNEAFYDFTKIDLMRKGHFKGLCSFFQASRVRAIWRVLRRHSP